MENAKSLFISLSSARRASPPSKTPYSAIVLCTAIVVLSGQILRVLLVMEIEGKIMPLGVLFSLPTPTSLIISKRTATRLSVSWTKLRANEAFQQKFAHRFCYQEPNMKKKKKKSPLSLSDGVSCEEELHVQRFLLLLVYVFLRHQRVS